MKTASETGTSKGIRILQIIFGIIVIGLSITIIQYCKSSLSFLSPSKRINSLKFLGYSTIIIFLSIYFILFVNNKTEILYYF